MRKRRRVQIWVAPFFQRAQQERKSDVGWHAHTDGVLGGVDFALTRRFYTGIAAGYTADDLRWKEERGKGSIHSTSLSLYGAWVPRYFYMNFALTGAYNKLHGSRNIRFAVFDRIAKHHQNNQMAEARVEMGVRIPVSRVLRFRPFARLDYTYLDEKTFKEDGAESLNLEVEGKKLQFLRAEAGANISLCLATNRFNWIPEARASWIREKRLHGKHFTTKFRETDVSFKVKGQYPSRDLFSAGGNLTFQSRKSLTALSLYYDFETSEYYSNQVLSLQFNLPF